MEMGRYEVPVAYSMMAMAAQAPERRPDAIQQFMCYWVAFNNIYVTIALRAGRRAELRRNLDGSIRTRAVGQVSVPEVTTVSEREQLDLAFRQFPEGLKERLVEHPSTLFFARRTPSWHGQLIERDGYGQRLNGVLNVTYTVDARHPVWAPIDTAALDQYNRGGKTLDRLDAVAKQVLALLYTVRNNTFHGGKRADDANDQDVMAKALPLLAMIVRSFIRVEPA